jgi:sialic acid synthase SpsE
LAVAHGASIIEKHVTGDKFEDSEGKPINPDAAFMSVEEFAAYIKKIRAYENGELDPEGFWGKETVEKINGLKNPKRPLHAEMAAWKEARRSLVTTRPLAKGEYIKEGDLEYKRPGIGFLPTLKNIKYVVGKKTLVEIPENSIIHHWMIEKED